MDDQSFIVEFSYEGIPVSMVLPSMEDHVSKTIAAAKNFYELEMLRSISGALSPHDVVIDAGANVGNHTVFFGKILGCRVHAFEAVESTADFLARNVAENQLQDRVQVHVHALGAREGFARVAFSDEKNIGGTRLEEGRAGGIRVLPLDEVGVERPVRLLKIDVEGMDLDVLRGASRILAEDKPWVICEASGASEYREIAEFLREINYLAVGVYNATDTYLFLPVGTKDDIQVLMQRSCDEIMALQRDVRHAWDEDKRLARYAERMKVESIAVARQEVQAESRRLEEVIAKTSDEFLAKMRIMQTALVESQLVSAKLDASESLRSEQFESHQKIVAAWELALSQARAEADRERDGLIEERETLRHELEFERNEIAVRSKELSDMKQVLSQVREKLRESEGALNQLAVDGEGLRLRLRETEVSLADKQRRLRGSDAALVETRQRLLVLEAESKRLERSLADKHRRVREAHAALLAERESAALKSEDLRASIGHLGSDLATIRESVSFQSGQLLVASLKSPFAAIALTWRMPRLFWVAWQKRRNSGT